MTEIKQNNREQKVKQTLDAPAALNSWWEAKGTHHCARDCDTNKILTLLLKSTRILIQAGFKWKPWPANTTLPEQFKLFNTPWEQKTPHLHLDLHHYPFLPLWVSYPNPPSKIKLSAFSSCGLISVTSASGQKIYFWSRNINFQPC